MDPILERYHALEDKIKTYNPALDTQRLFNAFNYADNAHAGQLRKDGSAYITHPLAVAEIVAELELDTDSIIAALLHDCIEDTGVTHEGIAKLFGITVADLVEGVTKLTRVQYTSKEEEQMENLRKMLMAMAKDIRVILIKICDRLHNMRTMAYQTPRKQKEKALETMEIYAPIAHRLGMQRIKWELEDTSLKYLDPIGYQEIADELAARSSAHEEFLSGIQKRIQERLDEEGIRCTIYGRVKHIYSIYRKMYAQNKTMDEIFDLYAFRVIVDDIPDCYNVLGVIHDLYKPVLGRFKDYIGTPKPNGYQSLHTTVIGREGLPFEVQIRTWEMHHTAEYGIAAHWKYKQGMANEKLGTEEAFEWVRKLLESQQDIDAEEFVRTMRVDLFADEVFVFTPRGDVINLPAGATPIDFAYNIHSAVGNHMTGAKVNGRMVPFDTALKNGDIVEVITSKSAHGPSRDWMKICKSNEARNKIRQWFKKERREENIATGRACFESELKHAGLSLAAITAEDVLPFVLKKARFGTLDELYAAIGYGGMSAQKAVVRIKDEIARLGRVQAEQQAAERAAQEAIHPATGAASAPPPRAGRKSESGIIVEGLDNCLVKFAKCCTPVPGDPVVGFITRGFGVSVHRQDCPNAAAERRKPEEAGRWIRVSWAAGELASYQTSLEISAKDRDGLTLDVAMALSAAKVKTTSLSARSMPDGYASVNIVLEVKNQEELSAVINKLGQIQGVYQVKRAAG
ncbi:bifunctional (p)ppGpp synthetase/guanosine-3',5'-bis(diphosphate) 3'-pyrophosphohydrolase [Flavonifractor sp. DFI.6.63]|uniref:GTP diphosphokinase n=2 Tax=Lawsonibacter TaxID=2172004 RepID=A0A8J6JFE8_9FIRM|nr:MULTISPECIES: bifunctional (p)ppGpp synthetase/guanosine-3',5'-bis(diphosphate) 3'-pyrophosphohydrolase [Oscillospiraceae]MBC5734292.1 bifunctional (p)ppGpp synthetase/guanosine-3',5'-bis(diphosphate) 3'-pyrophosphohydrolase [Lawsonibacter hominis]MBS1384792.1 bifunctional (p)ppGpp synthetase/guanosine-3',5'-bis(diphosphate) 3'-pyrophosphohydrolase [Flavonifractor sp.]MCQ5027967.1 bifunctional (p)ppGpp synthetase/guanosine-3',5'-bis(diphosphate) 3'-pyrophosphohydrolase [Flavonifractor sp. DFI